MLNENFMLKGSVAAQLYNEVAKNAPIYDYHCHLSVKEIYEDNPFTDITALWLEHDHYKWRAMRYAGIPEEYITGTGDGLMKFKAWAGTCERLIGSPLYHWANLELKTYFGTEEVLNSKNAEKTFQLCNDRIKKEELSPVKMIKKSNVKLICTTDDPSDSLKYHRLLQEQSDLGFKVIPTFRPDKALNIQKEEFLNYIQQLAEICSQSIMTYSELMQVLRLKIKEFNELGCRVSDHSLESLSYQPTTEEEVERIFADRIAGISISKEDEEKFRSFTLIALAAEYHKYGWAMQLHIGAMRNVNEKAFERLGADAGYDIMNDFNIAGDLVKLLNKMDCQEGLPKTILYTLNSKDNLFLSSIPHCFAEDGVAGKVQFGPAWWFNDNKDEIEKHLKSIANQGMLADFIGMLTDSRSFLSYVRHDYFRRILCSFIGELFEKGQFENDMNLLKSITEGICYKNVINYLGLEEV